MMGSFDVECGIGGVGGVVTGVFSVGLDGDVKKLLITGCWGCNGVGVGSSGLDGTKKLVIGIVEGIYLI
jgi:hypothetical protein